MLFMNRMDFAKILSSITAFENCSQEELKNKTLPISRAITELMPDKLFRFRSCNDNNITAFENDYIYTVTADRFNDPYGTLLCYDIDLIKQNIENVSKDSLSIFKTLLLNKDLLSYMNKIIPDEVLQSIRQKLISTPNLDENSDEKINEIRKEILSEIDYLSPIIEFIVKRSVTLACFSESVQSVIMWSHYAQEHEGFALEYRPRYLLTSPIKDVVIFPVIYNEQRYEASNYSSYLLLQMLGLPVHNSDIFAEIKCALHKSPQWEYENEWRMINVSQRNILQDATSIVIMKPTAIYYGKNIEKGNRDKLHKIAQTKNICEYDMYIDNASLKYEMLYRPFA